MINKGLQISIILILSSFIFIVDDYRSLGVYYFYILILFVGLNIIIKKKIELIHIWNAAFVFIILSEVFIYSSWDMDYSLKALQFLILANNIFNIGYISKDLPVYFSNNKGGGEEYRLNRFTGLMISILVLLYCLLSYKSAMIAFAYGRDVAASQSSSNPVVGAFVSALGFVLPSIIAYYYVCAKNKSFIKALILSFPIFMLLIISGTRFPLLFSMLGFAIVVYKNYQHKAGMLKYFILIFALIFLIGSSTLMKGFRSSIAKNQIAYADDYKEYTDFPSYIAKFMSAEGVIDMTSLMFRHFDDRNHLYGASSSFLLYFWVPRNVWPDKPTMLGHWLIRNYRGSFGEGHSSSFGFTGELYADFGYLSLIAVLLLGRFLKVGESFVRKAFLENGFSIVLASMFFPYVFFFVRSPVTATMNFLGILFLYFLSKGVIIMKPKPSAYFYK